MTTSPAARSSPPSGPASPPPPSSGRSPARSATRSRSRRSAAPPGAGRRSWRAPTGSATRGSSCAASPARWTSPRCRSSRARASPGRRRTSPRSGIVVRDLGASSRMHEKDPAAREKQFDEGRRFIDLAQAMGVPVRPDVRGQDPAGEPKEEVMKRVVEGFQQMAAYAKPAGVTVLIESHGDFTHSADLDDDPDPRRLAAVRAALGRAPLLRRRQGDSRRTPTRSSASGSATRTSRTRSPRGPDRRYVLIGTGEVPVKEQVRVLAQGRLQGLLLLRVGEEVAPRDRGARGRVPAVREGHGASTWPRPG